MTWVRTHVITPTGAARFWVSLGLFGLAVAIAVGFAIAYTQHVQRQMCGFIVALDEGYRETPPPTETGKNIAAKVAETRKRIGC
jgi:hypothetical protein